ncbi:MAG TPA: MoxR family ATPase [Puia sp.]|jgi:MoxR-like ATPase|nr:MoxR family ATPase [Puia sp.]
MPALEQIKELKRRIQSSIIGQEDVVTKILIGLLTDGNVLLEGMPGLAKTRAVKSLASHLSCKLSRIQFTPDLLPSDITGTEIYQPQSEEKFIFQPGPVFSNLVLADEINRAPAKVQAALLEAMEERQVSVAGKTHKMEPLFMVLATENPIEQEGTYPLPEAQLDRFIMKIEIGYPAYEDELKIVRLVREETAGAIATTGTVPVKEGFATRETLSQQAIFEARREIGAVRVGEAAERYMADLVSATRYPEKFSKDLKKWISYGASPRGTIALDKCSRVVAWLDGRDFVTPDDIRFILPDVLRHRILLSYGASADGLKTGKVLDELVKNVSVT